MPSTLVENFTEPDEYASAMRQGTVRFTVMQRGNFAAKLCRLELYRLWMQRFSVSLAWTSHVDYWGGRVAVAFQTGPGPTVTRNGHECAYDSITRLRASESYYLGSRHPVSYGTLSVPLDEMARLGAVVGGYDPTKANDYLSILTPSPSALQKLRRLHEAAGDLAEDAPAVLSHPEAARNLEQALIEAMLHCLKGNEAEDDRAAQRRHVAIMRRFHRAIEQSGDQPLYIPELCKDIGVSERTLRACCDEHLGMNPKRYLVLRRMYMVRRALQRAAPSETTVTEIATRYGFWQFGRLSVEYRSLFGESPSATLARLAD